MKAPTRRSSCWRRWSSSRWSPACGNDRYRLLDTLRAYALDVLADLDADETRNRHAGYYVQRAEQGELEIRGPDQLAWLDRFRSDLNNFRAALEWGLSTGDTTSAARLAGALAWFWTLNGMLTEAIQHLERLIEIDDVPPPTRAKCLWGYALLASSLGRLETARAAAYRAVACGRPVRHRRRRLRPQRRRRRRMGARQPRPIARRSPPGDHAARPARRPLGAGRVPRPPGPHPVRPRRRHGSRRRPHRGRDTHAAPATGTCWASR